MKRLLVVLPVLAAALTLWAGLAGASTGWLTGDGTGSGTVNPATLQVSVLPQGGQLLVGDSAGPITGMLDGSITQHFAWRIFAGGRFVYVSTGHFSGTLGECGHVDATFLGWLTGQISPDGSIVFSGGAVASAGHGTVYEVAISGSGKNDGSPLAYKYSGRYRCG